MAEQNKGNWLQNKRNLYILSALFIVILSVLGVLYFREKNQVTEFIDDLNTEKELIAKEFRELTLDYDSLYTDNDSLNLRMEAQQQQINELLTELNDLKTRSYREIAKYRKELTTLRSVLRHYVAQVDSLNQLNQALVEENQKLGQQFASARNQVRSLTNKTQTLEKTVAKAAILEAINIEVTPLNKRGRKTIRQNKIDKIQVCFTITKNITAVTGEKTIYLRIMDPDKKVLAQSTPQTFNYDNQQLEYSSAKDLTYDGEPLDNCMFYTNDEKLLLEGNYFADLFADGNLIGTAQFELR